MAMKTIHSARMLLLNISIEAASKSLLFYIEHRPAQHFGMVRACGSPGRFDELVDQGCRVLLGNPRHTEQRREALSSLNWTTLATGRKCGAVDLVSARRRKDTFQMDKEKNTHVFQQVP